MKFKAHRLVLGHHKRKERKSAESPLVDAAVAFSAGTSMAEIVERGVHALAAESSADRVGLWLEPELSAANPAGASFRGVVWDRSSDSLPTEWQRFSPEAALPMETLIDGGIVDQELKDGALPLMGPLLGLRRALWVPVAHGGQLHGILLAGTCNRDSSLSAKLFETYAAQLALIFELQTTRRLAQERLADLTFVKEMLSRLRGSDAADAVLSVLIESCTNARERPQGLGLPFAAIGASDSVSNLPDATAPAIQLNFRWKSGHSAALGSIEEGPMTEVWRKALATKQLTGVDASAWAMREGVSRIIAIPLFAETGTAGVLVAGLSTSSESLAIVERLELRAGLASNVLAVWQRQQQAEREAAWTKVLLENSADVIVALDSGGQVSAISESANVLLSEHASEKRDLRKQWMASRLSDFFQPGDQQRIESWSRALMGMGGLPAKQREIPVALPEGLLKNGTKVRLRAAPPAGGARAVITLDVVQSADSSASHSRAETELRNVLEWLDEGVLVFDAQENIRAMNARFLQITGLDSADAAEVPTLENLIGKLAGRVAQPWSFAQRWRDVARGIDGGIREELQLVRPAPVTVQRVTRPILDGSGRRLGHVEIYRDLTARQGFQSKLLHMEKLAALGQVVTSVVHELNNPLTSILGYAQRLLQSGESAEKSREVGHIFEEAERATGILRQLLLNARESKTVLRTVELNRLVTETMELQQTSLVQENIRLDLQLDSGTPFVHGDEGQLRQVLMNLTGNARQAIAQTGKAGKIRVRTRQVGEQRVLLEVSDDGPGIPPEILGRIFDPFFTTKPAGIGTGLGLAIVLGIVREHGGHVNVSSPPTGGAIFSVALQAASVPAQVAWERGAAREHSAFSAAHPAQAFAIAAGATAPLPSLPPRPPANLARRPSQPKGSVARILVVEDEPTVGRLIADVLGDEGFDVDVHLDGKEALRQAQREIYDLVVCDMKMPGVDGQQFYKALAQSGNPLSRKFLFVTGDVVSPHTHQFLERHGLPHVAKPFRMEELKERVRNLLDRRANQEQPAEEAHEKAHREG